MPRPICRACSATIRWIEMESGRVFPVDPVPTPRTGNVAARLVGTRYVAGYVITSARPLRDGWTAFDSHYRVCDMKRRTRSGAPRSLPQPLF